MKRKTTILDKAKELVYGERNRVYGHPLRDFTKQAAMMSAVLASKLKEPISPQEIPLLMICVKLSRLEQTPGHLDSLIDIAGYCATAEMCLQSQDGSENE
jgi:hypothetical protein